MYRRRCISVLFLFQRLIYVGLRQQRMTAIGKEKLLAVVVEDVHVRDTALKIGHIVHGILGILAVAKNFVLMLQQFGVFHTEHIDPLLWGCNGRCLLAKPCKTERVRLTLCFHYQSRPMKESHQCTTRAILHLDASLWPADKGSRSRSVCHH